MTKEYKMQNCIKDLGGTMPLEVKGWGISIRYISASQSQTGRMSVGKAKFKEFTLVAPRS